MECGYRRPWTGIGDASRSDTTELGRVERWTDLKHKLGAINLRSCLVGDGRMQGRHEEP